MFGTDSFYQSCDACEVFFGNACVAGGTRLDLRDLVEVTNFCAETFAVVECEDFPAVFRGGLVERCGSTLSRVERS